MRIALAPDGTLWVTAYGKLLQVGAHTRRVVKRRELPAGDGGGPNAVTVDARGRHWYMGAHSGRLGMIG